MKKTVFIVFFCFSFLAFSQNKYNENYQRKFLEFYGCEKSINNQDCFSNKLADFIVKNISTHDMAYILKKNKNDTIKVNSLLFFDKQGKIEKKDSKIGFFYGNNKRNFNSLVEDFPEVKPLLDENGKGVNTQHTDFLYFKLHQNKLLPIYGFVPKEVSFAVIENVPVYKGCDDSVLDNKELKKCMSSKINTLIIKNFNIKKASKGIPKGTVKSYASFKVGKYGEVRDLNVRAQTKKLRKEITRVLNLIPKLEKPGYQRGQPVIVPYSLPIVFKVE